MQLNAWHEGQREGRPVFSATIGGTHYTIYQREGENGWTVCDGTGGTSGPFTLAKAMASVSDLDGWHIVQRTAADDDGLIFCPDGGFGSLGGAMEYATSEVPFALCYVHFKHGQIVEMVAAKPFDNSSPVA